jgi:photosynthetic reaction center H subunit
MAAGSLTYDIDLVQVMLVAFAFFFGGLVIYLRREDKREGYPLLSRQSGRTPVLGWPSPPPAKTYRLIDGDTAQMPHDYPQAPIETLPIPRNGAPIATQGDLLRAGIGAGAYTLRSDEPMRTLNGDLLLKPLRDAPEWSVWPGDMDPRGCRVLGSNFRVVGSVSDIWVDRAAKILRYFEVTLDGEDRTIIVPIFHTSINQIEREIRIIPLKPEQLTLVPRLSQPNLMTAREEDRLNAFYAGATLYADPLPPLMEVKL